jgi:hypothetical protein
MRLRLLFTFGLVLCLSTIATSNECLRYGHHATGVKAANPAPPINGEYSTLLVSKLLYI